MVIRTLILSLFLAACQSPPVVPTATTLPPSAPPPTVTASAVPATATGRPTPPPDYIVATEVESQPGPTSPFQPSSADKNFVRGEAYLASVQVVLLESSPPQAALRLAGSLPTPCHQLRVQAAPPDAQQRILVKVYSVADPNVVCVQMLAAFDETISLGAYPGGRYEVWVNQRPAGEFKTP